MIRKVLLFGLLLAAGFAALHYAVGWESLAGSNTGTKRDNAEPRNQGDPAERPESVPGLTLPGGDAGEIVPELRGRLELWLGERQIDLGTSSLRLPRATLVCADSAPLADGRQRMDDVRVEFYTVTGDAGRPTNRVAVTLTAATGFAELMADRLTGERSVRSDKEVELRDVRVETAAGTSLPHAILTVDKLFALVFEDRVVIDTDEREPFALDVGGPQPMRLTGDGLDVRMPLGEPAQGRVELVARHNPDLTYGVGADAMNISGRGSLSFTEVLGSGSAQITLEDDVVITLPGGLPFGVGGHREAAGSAAATDAPPTLLTGDRLVAQLARGRGALGGAGRFGTAMVRSLRLRGAPTTVEGPGLRMECVELVAVPALDGQPFAISALGNDTTLVVEEERKEGVTRTTFEAGRHIHMVRPKAYLAPLLGSFGLPTWTAGPFARRNFVVFEGRSEIVTTPPMPDRSAPAARQSNRGTLTLNSDEGMVLWAGDDPEGPAILRGTGATRFSHGSPVPAMGTGTAPAKTPSGTPEPLVATGSDGFTLTRLSGTDGDAVRVELGPAADPDHAFELRRRNFVVRGTGSCVIERPGDRAPAVVTLRSPAGTIRAQAIPTDDPRPVHFDGLEFLKATVLEERLVDIEASGAAGRGTWTSPDGEIEARFQTLADLGPTGYLLTGTEAEPASMAWRGPLSVLGGTTDGADRPAELLLRGPEIEMYHLRPVTDASTGAGIAGLLGGGYLMVDARSPTGGLTHLALDLPATDHPTATGLPAEAVRLDAHHIQLRPFAVAPGLSAWGAGGAPGFVQRLAFAAAERPWLIADDEVHFTRTVGDPDQPIERATASGDHLLLGLHNRTGRLTGSPATASWDESQKNSNRAAARVIRFAQTRDGPVAVLERDPEMPPVLTMLDADPARPSYRATVDGAVHLTPGEAWGDGPAELIAVDPLTGEVDPEGVAIGADDLRVRRHTGTGEPMSATARGNATFSSGSIAGRASRVDVDLLRHTLRATEPGGRARVTMGNDVFEALTVEANYRDMTVHCWHGSFELSATEPRRRSP